MLVTDFKKKGSTFAAESLLVIADIYPRALDDHPGIATAVYGDPARVGAQLNPFGRVPPLTPDQRARLAVAADQLDAEISGRLSAGRCSKPAAPTMDDLYVIPVREKPIVALVMEESIGSCERKLAFVVFLESPGGFSPWLGVGISGRDPLHVEIKALPEPVTVTYARTTGTLTVGTQTIDAAKANVAVLSAATNGVTVRYQRRLDLTFERHGRPPSEKGVALIDFQPEIATAVRALLDRTPDLRDLVRGPHVQEDFGPPRGAMARVRKLVLEASALSCP